MKLFEIYEKLNEMQYSAEKIYQELDKFKYVDKNTYYIRTTIDMIIDGLKKALDELKEITEVECEILVRSAEEEAEKMYDNLKNN